MHAGVEYKLQGEGYKHFHIAYAAKEVVLSCGTVGTPQLLMLSGIGPKQHLREYQIPVIRYIWTVHNLITSKQAEMTLNLFTKGSALCR